MLDIFVFCDGYALTLGPTVAGNDHLREVFGKTMGLSDTDIVALSGGHTLVSVIFQS